MNYTKRIQNARKLLPKLKCDALLIENPINIFYLTGMDVSTGKLLIGKEITNLIVDGRYFETCSKHSACPVLKLETFSLEKWAQSNAIDKLGFDSALTSYQAYLGLKELPLKLVPTSSPIEQQRLIKDQDEIESLKKASKLGFEGFLFVESLLEEGVTEEQLAFELEFFWKKKGAKKLAFDPIIAFGENSSMPHYRAGSTPLKKGMHVLIDIGVVYQHYHSDMTRVVYFGKPNPEIEAIYKIVEEAKRRAIELCRPGVLIEELDKAARAYIESKGYGKNFTHSLGHGVGLEIHERPTVKGTGEFSRIPLRAGMVITIEPGIYLPGVGGVRLEDTILITDTGYVNLTEP